MWVNVALKFTKNVKAGGTHISRCTSEGLPASLIEDPK